MQRILLYSAIGLIFVLGSGCDQKQTSQLSPQSIQSAPQNARNAVTWNYWQSLITIERNNPCKGPNSAMTLEQNIYLLRQLSIQHKQQASDISLLPVINVDREATNYASLSVEVHYQNASIFADLADYFEEYMAFVKYSNSDEAGMEAFMRGFLGDPIGPYNDNRAQKTQFEDSKHTIFKRVQALEEQQHKLDAYEITARAALTERYGREFPKIIAGNLQ
jgi:hypothetical protein